MPRTCVPVPITQIICEKECCTMHAFPVRCCVAITGHKSQGMTVASGEPYETCIIHLPEKGEKVAAGYEMVVNSRPKALANFCYGNEIRNLDKSALKKIGQSDAHTQRRRFQEEIKRIYNDSKEAIKAEIGTMDPMHAGPYKRGCAYLNDWYRKKFWT